MDARKPSLKRTLGIVDATSIGLGAIIGAGIFVVLGVAAGASGPGVVISVILAAVVSSFTAMSFASLGSTIPKEGGAYEYAYELLSPSLGFLTGWMWIFGQLVGGAAVSLGLAEYFSLFIPIPIKFTAVAACLLFTILNTFGVKESSFANNVMVAFKVGVLCVFIVVGIPHIQIANFSTIFATKFPAIINGAALIFFAFLGYGRITTLSEEVKNPRKVIPLSILLALGISALLYLLVSFTALGIASSEELSNSGSPLADVMKKTGNDLAVALVSLGGVIATISVLLTTLLGVSRVVFAMSRNRQIPERVNAIHPKFCTPYISILLSGILMALIALLGDLKQVLSLATFTIISTHVLVNYSALKIKGGTFIVPFSPIPQILGIVSCSALALSLLLEVWLEALMVVSVGTTFYLAYNRFAGNKREGT
ncbi:MAG: amino acid permease [Nitrososphaeria archaeon]